MTDCHRYCVLAVKERGPDSCQIPSPDHPNVRPGRCALPGGHKPHRYQTGPDGPDGTLDHICDFHLKMEKNEVGGPNRPRYEPHNYSWDDVMGRAEKLRLILITERFSGQDIAHIGLQIQMAGAYLHHRELVDLLTKEDNDADHD